MGCGCKQPVVRNPKPVETPIPIQEIDYFNNIDIITPISNEEENREGTTDSE